MIYKLEKDVLILSFAGLLKEHACGLSGIPMEYFHDQSKKETACHRVHGFESLVSARDVLIEYGNMFRSYFGDDYFSSYVEHKIKTSTHSIVIVTDTRFPGEINMLKRLGAEFIYINRDKWLGLMDEDADISETSTLVCKNMVSCYEIDNNVEHETLDGLLMKDNANKYYIYKN